MIEKIRFLRKRILYKSCQSIQRRFGDDVCMLQNQKQLKVRNSSIELLRIIAMIMIVFHHFVYHGEFEWESSSIPITRLWNNFIFMGGKIGVNVFVIISGYYLINNDGKIFDIGRIAKFVGQVFFYSIAIYVIFGMIGISDIGVLSFIKSCFPITFSQWWFASTYFVLYLLHPFLNKLLCSLDKSLYQRLLVVLVVCWSIIPTFTTSLYQSNSLLWFVTLYSISGYIRLYGLNHKFTGKHYFVFFLICSFLTYASSVVFTTLGNKWKFFESNSTYLYGQEKITTLLISLCLFMMFVNLKLNYHRWINKVASATFGVYLIHDNKIIRQCLWVDLFKNAQYQDSLFLIPYSIIVVIAVYIACSAIDLLRQYIIEKPFMMIVKRYSEKMIIPINKIVIWMKNVVFGK